jgi:hypothetical protein
MSLVTLDGDCGDDARIPQTPAELTPAVASKERARSREIARCE